MELLIRDVALHRIEMTLLTIAFIVCVVVGAVYVAYVIIRWLRRKERECERDENDAPECKRTCLNVREECSEREEECLRYEPKRARKHYDPRTGEVG